MTGGSNREKRGRQFETQRKIIKECTERDIRAK